MGKDQKGIKPIPELPEHLMPCDPVELPSCAKGMHVGPNACFQSALFGMVARGSRKYLNGQKIVSFKGLTISYTGEQLDQGDLDVFIHAVHLTTDGFGGQFDKLLRVALEWKKMNLSGVSKERSFFFLLHDQVVDPLGVIPDTTQSPFGRREFPLRNISWLRNKSHTAPIVTIWQSILVQIQFNSISILPVRRQQNILSYQHII